MEEVRRWQDGALGNAKVGRDVLRVGRFVDEGRMTHRIGTVLIGPSNSATVRFRRKDAQHWFGPQRKRHEDEEEVGGRSSGWWTGE